MSTKPSPIDQAIARMAPHGVFRLNDRVLTVAFLLRENDWRPLHAEWWRGKEACIIGAELNGNFFLRHCDGTVRLWDHRSQTAEIIASSVKEFARRVE